MTKLISVRDEVYALLSSRKRDGESFSELFLRFLDDEKPKKSFQEHAGAWKDFPEADLIFKKILERRSIRKPVKL
ncbi:MAG TPA: antitoxin VapB family protein [Candidatus Norongarragalinales archaeon]|nr:antitoxin VapB family protein [Candidatus Norongarragalinales archaeon]